mmetsp:Transcript_37521/g.113127  ORF Transcript_37521/g.113127 Transcript_37521/m.113127 type:complete len:248 (+) Transcript_37521:3114-3857(+)
MCVHFVLSVGHVVEGDRVASAVDGRVGHGRRLVLDKVVPLVNEDPPPIRGRGRARPPIEEKPSTLGSPAQRVAPHIKRRDERGSRVAPPIVSETVEAEASALIVLPPCVLVDRADQVVDPLVGRLVHLPHALRQIACEAHVHRRRARPVLVHAFGWRDESCDAGPADDGGGADHGGSHSCRSRCRSRCPHGGSHSGDCSPRGSTCDDSPADDQPVAHGPCPEVVRHRFGLRRRTLLLVPEARHSAHV